MCVISSETFFSSGLGVMPNKVKISTEKEDNYGFANGTAELTKRIESKNQGEIIWCSASNSINQDQLTIKIDIRCEL